MRKPGQLFGCVLFGCVMACGGDATHVVVAPRPVEPVLPKAPPPGAARWVFVTPESGINDAVDLGNGSTLFVGDHGRREVVHAGVATDAPTLAPDTIIGILRDEQGHFVFVTDGADTYVSHDPLGSFDAVHKGPADPEHGVKLRTVATGRASAVALMTDGSVLRTSDGGVSWKPITYTANKPFGHASHVDLDHKGNGLLLHLPQRLYVTHDDGATWAPIAAPPAGVHRFIDDGSGQFFAEGFDHKLAKLEGDKLVPTDEVVKKMTPGVPSEASASNVESVRIVSGDRVVEVEATAGDDTHPARVRATRLGDKPGPAKPLAELGRGLNQLAGYGSNLIYIKTNEDDENTPTSTVMLSNDYGATWKSDVRLEGATNGGADEHPARVSMGPNGWAFIPALCGSGLEPEGNCAYPKVRVAGGTTFDDMLFTEQLTPISFAFDAPHDKVYVVGQHDSQTAIYVSRLSQNKFSRLFVPTSGSWSAPVLSVNADGVVHVFDLDEGKITVERRDASGKELPKLYLPSKRLGRDRMVFAGARGVLFTGESYGWETADAGVTWVRVAANGAGDASAWDPDVAMRCSEAGCAVGEAQRVGWDLPGHDQPAPENVVTATTTVPEEKDDTPREPPRITTAPPPLSLTCKIAGPGTLVPNQPAFDNINEKTDIRWVEVQEDKDGARTLLIGGRASIRRVKLFDAAATTKGIERQTAWRMLNDGVVAARYTSKSQTPGGSPSPVDVELAAFALATGRLQRVSIPKLDSFRVASYGFSGDVQLVTGGVLYQSTDRAPLYFAHDGGGLEQMSLPPHTTLGSAQHVDNAWLLFNTDSAAMAEVRWSTDKGATWQTRAWALSDIPSRTSLIRAGDRPMISSLMLEMGGLFPVAIPAVEELPVPFANNWSTPMDTVCDPHAPYGQTFNLPVYGSTVHTTLDMGDKKPPRSLELQRRLAEVTMAGAFCTNGFVLHNDQQGAIVYHDGKGYSGWSFRTPEHDKGKLAEPISCTVAK